MCLIFYLALWTLAGMCSQKYVLVLYMMFEIMNKGRYFRTKKYLKLNKGDRQELKTCS